MTGLYALYYTSIFCCWTLKALVVGMAWIGFTNDQEQRT